MRSISERVTAIHHLAWPVGDLDLAEHFYKEVFGAEVTRRVGNHISIVIGTGPRIDLFQQDELPSTPGTNPHTAFDMSPDDLTMCAQILDEHGVSYDGITRAGRAGTANIYVDDPWGNHIELQAQNYSEDLPTKPRDRSKLAYTWPPKA